MQWNDLLPNLPVSVRGGGARPEIEDVTGDSRTVRPGSLYVSIPGFKAHGDTFIAEAIAKGAVAIISENPQEGCPVPWAQTANARKCLGLASRALLGKSLSETLFVGITGTNGKTTTAYLFQQLLNLWLGGDSTWMFGTVKYSLGAQETEAQRTTPESSDIFRTILQAPKKPRAVVMEVSSHALALDRVAGLLFQCIVWTNLTQDHLDFHKSMDDYYRAKKRLFIDYIADKAPAIINIDDPWGRRLASEVSSNIITYGTSGDATVRIIDISCAESGTRIDCSINGKTESFTSRLAGRFNAYNMAALVAGAFALGIDFSLVRQCFGVITVPGRMQRVDVDAGFSIFVDYAHTPDALEKACNAARQFTRKKLLCVFGCGGDRDKTKRPLMGSAVAGICDEAVITSDNPRSENPDMIIREILQGMPLDFPHIAISDRKEAIRKAISIARPGDCVLIAGKGHETYQETKGVRRHFDDYETAVEAVAKLQKQRGGNE
jgi:UDP-N-acetylmuramoyl-L-alanyl-D-glutamate--2,6-diaminopimelate ligase